MKNDTLWMFVYFLGVALWMFVFSFTLVLTFSSNLVLPYGNALQGKNLDLSLLILVLMGVNLFYFCVSIFVSLIYLLIANKVKDQHSKMRSQKIYNHKDNLCSIIIPARNEENVIRKNVIYCLRQTHKNIEVIVVCHNSTDGTFEEACVKDKRVKVFDLKTKEAGKSIALNYGVEQANGKYILVIDADSIISQDFIQNALPLFSEPHAAIQGRIRSGNRNYNFITEMLAMEDDLWSAPVYNVRHFFGNKCPLGGTGFVIRKDILIKVGMFANHLVDDAELTYRLLRKKYTISYAPLCIVYGEEPPAIDIMLRQRARWAKGFLNLLIHNVTDPTDILGVIYWLSPIGRYCGILTVIIVIYALIYNLLFGHFPYAYAFLPLKVWFFVMMISFCLSALVFLKENGVINAIKYVAFIPLYMVFSQYSFAVSIKAFFVKSWSMTKTKHGFTVEDNMEV